MTCQWLHDVITCPKKHECLLHKVGRLCFGGVIKVNKANLGCLNGAIFCDKLANEMHGFGYIGLDQVLEEEVSGDEGSDNEAGDAF